MPKLETTLIQVKNTLLTLLNNGDHNSALRYEVDFYNNYAKQFEEESALHGIMGPISKEIINYWIDRPFARKGTNVKKILFLQHSGARLGHTEVALHVLQSIKLREHGYELFFDALTGLGPDLENATRDLKIDTLRLQRGLPFDQSINSLHNAIAALDIGTVIWISSPVTITSIFPRRISQIQIFWSLKFHSVYFDKNVFHIGLPKIGSGDFDPEVSPLMLKNARFWIGYRASLNAPVAYRRDENPPIFRVPQSVIMATFARDEKFSDVAFRNAVYSILSHRGDTLYFFTLRKTNHFGDVPAHLKHRVIPIPWQKTDSVCFEIDIFLETFPFGCGITGVQALKSGATVISLWDRNTLPHFYSRNVVEAQAILPNWKVSNCVTQYVENAICQVQSRASVDEAERLEYQVKAKEFFLRDQVVSGLEFWKIVNGIIEGSPTFIQSGIPNDPACPSSQQIGAILLAIGKTKGPVDAVNCILHVCKVNRLSVVDVFRAISTDKELFLLAVDGLLGRIEHGYHQELSILPALLFSIRRYSEALYRRGVRVYVNHADNDGLCEALLDSLENTPRLLVNPNARSSTHPKILVVADKLSMKYISYATSYLSWLKVLTDMTSDMFFASDHTRAEEIPAWIPLGKFIDTSTLDDDSFLNLIKSVSANVVLRFGSKRECLKDYLLNSPIVSFDNVLEFDSGITYSVFNREMLYGWQRRYSNAKRLIFSNHWCWTLDRYEESSVANRATNLIDGRIRVLSFNRPLKYSERYIRLLAAISRNDDFEILFNFIQVSDSNLVRDLVRRLGVAGANLSRIHFLPRISAVEVRDHYTVPQSCFLDSFPCSGGLTSIEALWGGKISPIHMGLTGRPNTTTELYRFFKLDYTICDTVDDFLRYFRSEANRDSFETKVGDPESWEMLFDHSGFAEQIFVAIEKISRHTHFTDIHLR